MKTSKVKAVIKYSESSTLRAERSVSRPTTARTCAPRPILPGPTVFLSFYTQRYQKIRESQMKIAEEQCNSELSATPTCNMPWPRQPRPRPSVFIVSYASPSVPEDQIQSVGPTQYVNLRSTLQS